MTGRWTVLPTPIGDLLLTAGDRGLTGVYFEDHRGGEDTRPDHARDGRQSHDDPVLSHAVDQLTEYFAGTLTRFDLPLAPVGTDFQCRVWTALLDVPFGATASYGDIARRIGLQPGAARAVGLANGANPISIIIPCHRVIGADGSLTGYGGGLDRKRFLLDLEQGTLF